MGAEYKSIPLWKRGMSLAHGVYAAVEAAGVKGTEAGTRLRKAAVSVPSLVGEAYLDPTGREAGEALTLAEAKLDEVRRLLSSDPALKAIPREELDGLLGDLETLKAEITELRLTRTGETAH
jgi:four helix bundle protein